MKPNGLTFINRRISRLAARMGDERGMALIVTLLVMMVLTSLAIAVLQLTTHNVNQSAYDRRRDNALQAAEGGLNAYMASLLTAQGTAICTPVGGNLPGNTAASYSVAITIYDSNGSQLPCTGTGEPVRALVKSTGTAGPTGQTVSRTVSTLVDLRAIYIGLDKAIFSDQYLTLANRLTVTGNLGNDGDVYTNGNVAMNNSTTVYGAVYAQGSASISNSSAIYADVWANGAVTLDSNPVVFGNVMSSVSSVTLQNGTHVMGNVQAGTTITLQNNSTVDGAQLPNSPQGPPPAVSFPRIYWNSAVQQAWQNAGFTVQNFTDCDAAKTFIDNITGGDYVIRISPACALSWSNNSDIELHGNLAIVTDGSISTANNTTFTGEGGGPWRMYWIVPYPSSGSPNCSTWGGITVSNLTQLNNVDMFVYTPCTINYGNNNTDGWNGQLIGGVVNITNQMELHYKPLTVPSYQLTGYKPSPNYIREIKPGS